MAIVVLTLAQATGVHAEANDEVRPALERFFTSETLESEWFAPSFLDVVPFAQLQPIREQVIGSLGEYEGLEVAYKGGSEPGVLNLTTWVEDEDGAELCVCATRNADAEVDLSSVSSVVTRIFDLLREE